jgi:hypothetical protein
MATGVFSLRKVYIRQYQNVDNRNFASWPESAIYGYYGGGGPFPYMNTITRLDFSSETISLPGKNLPSSRGNLAAVSSSSYGYFGGGYNFPGIVISTITRLDLSNETISDPGKNLPVANINIAATSSSSYGYFGGGGSGITAYLCTITRLDFSNETISLPGKNLPAIRNNLAATSSSSYGYFGGGFDSSIRLCVISRLDFSSETISDPGRNLPTSRQTLAETSSNSYGYFGGGFAPPIICTITRLDFSNETVSDPGKNLPGSRERSVATKSSSYGYFGGGYTPGAISTITRLDFSTENVSNPGNNFSTGRASLAALSGGQSIFRGSKTYGYITGGANPPAVGTVSLAVNKHDLSTTTVTPLPPGNALPALDPSPAGTGRSRHFGFSTNYFGYFSGGFQPGGVPGVSNRVSRLDFSNDTWNDPGKNLPTTRYNHSGVSAPHNYDRGYFASGVTFVFPNPIGPSNISTVTRIQYSTETVSNPGINLPFVSSSLAAVKTGSYGYFTGGITPPSNPVPTQGLVYSNVARLDFSNENISLPVNLPLPRHSMFSFHNQSYGYFCGGTGPNPVPPTPTSHCRIERLDFSNETISSRTNMPTAFPSSTSISSQFFGFTYGSVNVTQIHRFDFSSETFAPYTSTPLGLASSAAVTNGI